MKAHLKVASGFAAGRSHLHRQRSCEDYAISYRARTQKFACAVLADGAGSKSKSAHGAMVACATAARLLENNGTNILNDPSAAGVSLLHTIQTELRRVADEQGEPYEEYGSTLLFAAIYRQKTTWNAFLGQLGDGVVICRDHCSCRPVFQATNGEFINETVFTTCVHAHRHIQTLLFSGSGSVGFLLASDGVTPSLIDRSTGVTSNACAAIFSWVKKHRQSVINSAIQCNLEGVFRENTFDDVSLAMASYL